MNKANKNNSRKNRKNKKSGGNASVPAVSVAMRKHPIAGQHDYIETIFGNIVFDPADGPIKSVHQLQSVKVFVYEYGVGHLGDRLIATYQVAIDSFAPENLTQKLQPIFADLGAEEDDFSAGDHEAIKKVWMRSFSREVTESIDSYVKTKHGAQAKAFANQQHGLLGMDFCGALLEVSEIDSNILYSVRRRRGQTRFALSCDLSLAVRFTSQPDDPEFSGRNDFEWAAAAGEYFYRGKRYLFMMDFDAHYFDDMPEIEKEQFATSLRRHLCNVIHDVTGVRNAIEVLTLF